MAQMQSRPSQFVDPSLVFRVQMNGAALEDEWEKAGMRLLSSDKNHSIVVFSSTDDLSSLQKRLDAYDEPIPAGRKNKSYSNFVARIDEIKAIESQDRIGFRFKESEVLSVEDIKNDEMYIVDIELWEFGDRGERERKANEIMTIVNDYAGEVYDDYIGPTITVLRVNASGQALRIVLEMPEVANIDYPPEVDAVTSDLIETTLEGAPQPPERDADAPVVSVLDSGLNEHPLIRGQIEEMTSFPDDLGTADVHGHGTHVASVVVFGDLRDQICEGSLKPSARVVSVKVLNDNGQFPETHIPSKQIRSAIESILDKPEYNCRIFVMSLRIKSKNMPGWVGKLAATLDELAREHNILIFVSAGNRCPRNEDSYYIKFGKLPKTSDIEYAVHLEEGVSKYPEYLLEESNYIYEPAGASNVITVGALSNGSGLSDKHLKNSSGVREITTKALEPSPFTRCGPGAGGACKPDFVDIGGTTIFDPVVPGLRGAPEIPEAGIVTLNNDFTSQLLISKGGTSFSTPMLAKKTAELLRQFPDASANLIRALLANASSIPNECDSLLRDWDKVDALNVCGHGLVDIQRSAYSSQKRVVLYADDVIGVDQFSVYHVPIPSIFQTSGSRKICVSLAFDPPVRHTRAEYIGVRMEFKLFRGLSIDEIFEHCRSRTRKEGKSPEIKAKYKCNLKPGSRYRGKQTLQHAAVSYRSDVSSYGDSYYLVVECKGGWEKSAEMTQRFSVVVELSHSLDMPLYDTVRELQGRLRQRIRF